MEKTGESLWVIRNSKVPNWIPAVAERKFRFVARFIEAYGRPIFPLTNGSTTSNCARRDYYSLFPSLIQIPPRPQFGFAPVFARIRGI